MNININPDDIDITLSGSLVAKIASVFIPLFKSTLIPMIVNDLVQTVTTTIDTTVDQDLALYGIQEEIPYLAGVTFDYGQIGGGKVINDYAVMGFNGTFFDAQDVQTPSVSPVAFNLRDPNGKQF